MMVTQIPLLQSARVASPCNAVWEDMQAVEGERVHFCMGCQKNVYNLSAMSQSEAEGLLRRHEGRLCVRYYQRQDGTILPGDCAVGAQMVRMGLIRRSTMAAGLFVMLFGAMAAMNITQMQSAVPAPIVVASPPVVVTPQPEIKEEVDPAPYPVMGERKRAEPVRPVMMGAVSPRHDTPHKPAKPFPESENLPGVEQNNTSVPSEPDTTDAALLNPR